MGFLQIAAVFTVVAHCRAATYNSNNCDQVPSINGHLKVGQECFIMTSANILHATAVTTCEGYGGELAVVTEGSVMDALDAWMPGWTVWIGLYRKSPSSSDWVWRTKEGNEIPYPKFGYEAFQTPNNKWVWREMYPYNGQDLARKVLGNNIDQKIYSGLESNWPALCRFASDTTTTEAPTTTSTTAEPTTTSTTAESTTTNPETTSTTAEPTTTSTVPEPTAIPTTTKVVTITPEPTTTTAAPAFSEETCFSFTQVPGMHLAFAETTVTVAHANSCALLCATASGCTHFLWTSSNGMCAVGGAGSSVNPPALQGSILYGK